MANIQEQINTIKEKEYGEEIRGSIVDALLAVSDESADAKQATEQLLPAIDQATEAAQAATEAAKKAQDAADAVADTDVGELLEKFNDYVPNERTINNKPLSSNIELTYTDLGAVPNVRKINSHSLSSDITLTPKDLKNEPWTTYKTTNRYEWTLTYRKIGYKLMQFQLQGTFQGAQLERNINDAAGHTPIFVDEPFYFPVWMTVNGGVAGIGVGMINQQHEIHLSTPAYGNTVQYVGFGVTSVIDDLDDVDLDETE